jgi:hypothetical protein
VRSSVMTRRTRLGGLLLVAVGLLAACGGEGGEGGGPTVSPTRTPTATSPGTGEPTSETPTQSPSLEPPSPTRTRTATLPTPTNTLPTPTPSETPRPTSPEEEVTTAPSAEGPSETAAPSPSPETVPESAEEEAAEGQAGEDDGVPSWVWWVAAAVGLGCLVAVPLAVRGRRRASWRRELDRQESEVEWFARDLLRELRHAGSHDEMAGGWAVSQKRVAAAEDELTVLESTAPDEAGRTRARSLRDALRHARARMQLLVAPGRHETWALDLDTLMLELEGVLRPTSGAPSQAS